LEEFRDATEKKIEAKYSKLLDKQNYAEKEINQSIQLLSKELEKLKYELSDVIDQKFEHITRNLEGQTKRLRQTYDELCEHLTSTSKELTKSFKDKSHALKAMCATFFAKIEEQVDENNTNVYNIKKSHDEFESNFVNPAKEVDAKVFAMTQKIENGELAREAQFSVLKDTIRQLVSALET